MTEFNNISENFKQITENVENARINHGRKDEIRIMAVTKGVPYEKVNHAIELGIDLLGENRAQEFLQKEPFYARNTKKIEIHFIGGLQNNKVKYIIDKVSVIQSADSMKLLAEINKRAAAHKLVMDVLVEINIGCEWSKNGIEASALPELLAEAQELENVRLRGLMAIPPVDAEEKIYADMQKLFADAKASVRQPDVFDTLSVGMSGDYITAIKHGANIIRIGSALFGSR
ncbi:MAG: YggS family pyridoxal phosphate-dependent enzyme [Oscillospiraceae bacterium]|nr:YggS family pyridoxal phosphate-dependent enzyme [Oscillospiraceae bacterium]